MGDVFAPSKFRRHPAVSPICLWRVTSVASKAPHAQPRSSGAGQGEQPKTPRDGGSDFGRRLTCLLLDDRLGPLL